MNYIILNTLILIMNIFRAISIVEKILSHFSWIYVFSSKIFISKSRDILMTVKGYNLINFLLNIDNSIIL